MDNPRLELEDGVEDSSGDSDCDLAEVLRQSREESMREGSAFHRVRLPLLLVDSCLRVLGINQAARAEGVVPPSGPGTLRLGDALLCTNSASTPWGCGVSESCRSCLLRQTVERVAGSGHQVLASEVTVIHYPIGPRRVTRHLISVARLRASSAPWVLVVLGRLEQE
jgi:hypothetical protein